MYIHNIQGNLLGCYQLSVQTQIQVLVLGTVCAI